MNLNIAFDLDGTLITCENKQKYVLYSILKSFEDIGSITQEKLKYWWELKKNGYSTEKALVELGFSDAKKIADKWIELIENFVWSNLDRPFVDSLSTLKYLKSNHKVSISIITARRDIYHVCQTIHKFGFDKYIDNLIVVDPFKTLEEKERHLKSTKILLYVGDSETDYVAAINSGVKFVGLTRGQRSVEFLQRLGNIHIEEDLKFLNDIEFML